MAASHPDHAGSPTEAAERARRSAAINDAYQQLADPLTRAERLLERFAAPTPARATLSQDFLIEAMELREALDEAIASSDQARLLELRDAAEARRDAEIAGLAERFDELLAAPDSARAAALAAARDSLHRLRYIVRLVARATDPDGSTQGIEG